MRGFKHEILDRLTVAFGINASGQIIGGSGRGPAVGTSSSSGDFAWLLSGSQYTAFPSPFGWYGYGARGINNASQIVGEYLGLGGEHGFLATPVPEPSTLVLLAIGTLGVIGWAWRRREAA
jgi:hypothetical protein